MRWCSPRGGSRPGYQRLHADGQPGGLPSIRSSAVNRSQQGTDGGAAGLRSARRGHIAGRLDHCLAAHGYRRFRLTDEQSRQLDRFDPRQPERQVYLHSLASDPQVLATQAVSERGDFAGGPLML